MTTQPEALRLADWLEDQYDPTHNQEQAAAELRRLSAENERLHQINQSHEMKLSVRGYEIQIADLEAQRDALLEALRAMLEQFNYHTITGIVHDESAAIAKARAAIKAVEEGK